VSRFLLCRRDFLSGFAALAFSGCVAASPRSPGAQPSGPQFWLVRRGQARVYLLGTAEAKDTSWLTASIEKAWNESSALWLETPTESGADAKIIEELGHSSTRTFLESLAPAVRLRAEAYIAELGIDPASIQTMRPWLAYYTINGAFWTKYKQPDLVYPEQVLRERATRESKLIHSEYPTREALLKSFAAWSDELQSQWIELLLDFLDDQKAGLNDAYFGWMRGEPSTRALDRMRSKTPLLYQTIQAGRNVWWAHTIDELLRRPGVSFVLVGMNHALGPDGIPQQLQRLRFATPLDLRSVQS
jgi:uncharacterized protein YbaP (TraB family)